MNHIKLFALRWLEAWCRLFDAISCVLLFGYAGFRTAWWARKMYLNFTNQHREFWNDSCPKDLMDIVNWY